MPVVAQTAGPVIGQDLGGRVVLNAQIAGGGAGVNNKARLNALPGGVGGVVGGAYAGGGGAYNVRSAQMQATSSGGNQGGGAQFVLQSL